MYYHATDFASTNVLLPTSLLYAIFLPNRLVWHLQNLPVDPFTGYLQNFLFLHASSVDAALLTFMVGKPVVANS